MMNDTIGIQLARDNAAGLVHILDDVIQEYDGTGYGVLLSGLQTALIDAFGHMPDRPEVWPPPRPSA